MHISIKHSTEELIAFKDIFDKFSESFNCQNKVAEGLRLLYFVFDNDIALDFFEDIENN